MSIANVWDAAAIASFKYPNEQYIILWPFDQRSCHRAYGEDALNARKMNVCPGGAQPLMRGTTWAWKVQKIVDDNGAPKRMRSVVEERVINTARMNADDIMVVLATHRNFQEKKTMVETYLLSLDYQVLFITTFHWKLNPIERVLGQAKFYTCKFTNFSLILLRKVL